MSVYQCHESSFTFRHSITYQSLIKCLKFRTEIAENDNVAVLEKVSDVHDLEENSKKEILNNLEKLHDMIQDDDSNDENQAVSEIMEEKVSDLYTELQVSFNRFLS